MTTALVWTLLQTTVLFSTFHAHHARSTELATSRVVGSYVGSLFLAGACAGVFGGMTSSVVCPAGGRLKALVQGSLGAALLGAVSALAYLAGGWPPIAEHVEVWAAPLVLCGAMGGTIGSLFNEGPTAP